MDYFNIQLDRIVAAARSVAANEPFNVLFFSHRPEIFDASEFTTSFNEGAIKSITFIRNHQHLTALNGLFDLAIFCNNVHADDLTAMVRIRERNLAKFVFVWTFDNHHEREFNLLVNALGDVVVPSHKFASNFMRTPSTVLGLHVPLGTSQWSRATARRLFTEFLDLERKNGLHGGFVAWGLGDREKLVRDCSAQLTDNAIKLIELDARESYFNQSAEQRWHDWASHKTGLILPLTCDLSTRFFDSLLTGQVPIVPTWCRDLDCVISADLQESLPVIRFDTPTVDAVEAAWQQALVRFDSEGPEGVLRRHTYAVENHHVVNRIHAICQQVKAISTSNDIRHTADGEGVGFVMEHL